MRCVLFWDITQRRMVVPYRCFGTTFPSHLQGSNSPRSVTLFRNVGMEIPVYAAYNGCSVPTFRDLSVPSSRVKQSKKSVTLSRNVGMEIQVYAVYNPKTARISFCQIVYSDLQFAIVSAICTAHRRMSCSNTTTRRTSHYGKWVYRKSVYHIPLYINVYASSQKAINSKQKSKTRCLHYGRFYLPSWNET
jgi:hypothetical protein